MQIVINIPEKDYNNITPFLQYEPINGGFNLFKVLEVIKNGTPLPKGHGRLIDADALNRKDVNCANVPMNFIDTAPTIIEADNERSVVTDDYSVH